MATEVKAYAVRLPVFTAVSPRRESSAFSALAVLSTLTTYICSTPLAGCSQARCRFTVHIFFWKQTYQLSKGQSESSSFSDWHFTPATCIHRYLISFASCDCYSPRNFGFLGFLILQVRDDLQTSLFTDRLFCSQFVSVLQVIAAAGPEYKTRATRHSFAFPLYFET